MCELEKAVEKPVEVIWQPLPGSQTFALDSRADETLFCGTRGPGKTELQLAKFRMYVGLGYGKFWRGIIFDREYKNLDDIVNKSEKFYYRFQDGAKFKNSASAYKWVWPSGEELLFRAVKTKEDYEKYHGHEYPFIGWNELTKFPTSEIYDMMFSCNRSSYKPGKDGIAKEPIPHIVFSTTNSKGAGRIWVKKRFIDGTPYGKITKTDINVFNPQTQTEEIYTRSRVAIFGSFKENIYLTPQYIAGLMDAIKDENTKKSWLGGSWDVAEGEAFGDLWQGDAHVLPRFQVPANWRVDRAFDWGSTHPFSVGWFAQANGEAATLPDGRVWCPRRGSLIRIAEWYGTREIGSNQGLRMGPTEIANGIIDREISLLKDGWILKQPLPGPADNQIGSVITVEDETIKKKMEFKGVAWTVSDKSPGSRKNGYNLFRDRLKSSLTGEGPGFYVMANCKAFIEIVPNLPKELDEDDVDTTSEDHIYDDTRYRVLKGNDTYATSMEILLG